MMLQDIEIKDVQIRDSLAEVDRLMEGLQESEISLFSRSAPWADIRKSYLRHLIEMQEEHEGTCLIAFYRGRAVGFIFGYAEEQDDSRIEIYAGRELYVSDGYVDPAHRKKGIYKELNRLLEDEYIRQGVKRITRFTLANNEPMKQMLGQSGYQVTRLLYEKWL